MDRFDAYTRHVNPALGRFLTMSGRDLRLVRARAGVLEDADGRRFDDWVCGFGSFNLGHNPEPLKAAIREHLARDAPNLFVENLNPYAGELAAALTRAAGPTFGTCFFSNSGAEAVEAALKTALLVTGRPRIAFAEGAYHGTTLGALACMGEGLYRRPFASVLADFPEVAFGDLAALEKTLLAEDVAAFIVEPIQIEAGVRIASPDYLAGARELCQRHGALLIFDEVQTGMGRTGRLFAYQHAQVEPDILVLAKSLGGGLVPIGAAVMAEGLWDRAYGSYLRAEIHNCTFGGNALACAVALKALELIDTREFLDQVSRRGAELFAALHERLASQPIVERISGQGLLGGIKLRDVDHPAFRWENLGLAELAGSPSSGPLLLERLARHGILAQVCAHDWSVLRVEPPLTVDREARERFVAALDDSVRWLAAHDG